MGRGSMCALNMNVMFLEGIIYYYRVAKIVLDKLYNKELKFESWIQEKKTPLTFNNHTTVSTCVSRLSRSAVTPN